MSENETGAACPSAATSPPFPRTVCACPHCVACCSKPAHLAPYDIPRLQERFGERFEVLFRKSPGALVGQRDATGRLVLFRIPTITPRTENGRCVFQGEDGACGIHDIAPFGCAFFDVHMGDEEGRARSAWGLRAIMSSEEYAHVRETLSDA